MAKFDQYLSLKQAQRQELRPKMLQSLKMLSMPLLELEMHIKEEIMMNPLLELRDDRDSEEDRDPNETEESRETEIDDVDSQQDQEVIETMAEAKELSEILDYWQEFHQDTGTRTYDESSDDENSMDSYIRYEEDAKTEFIQQLYPLRLTEDELDFGIDLIDSIDQRGFLPEEFDLHDVADSYGIDDQRAEEIRQKIMHLDPKGICAFNLVESLIAQLDPEQLSNQLLINILQLEFESLIHRRYQKIASRFQVSEEAILNCRSIISKLDPKPGIRIASSAANYVVPDVTIKRYDDEFVVIVNDSLSPNVVLSSKYKKMINKRSYDRETVLFVRDKINSAKFLIKSMYMRLRTLERVCKSIIEHQRDFFYGGTGELAPLTYSVIAEDLQVSESTISRVVKNKYADTPYGIIGLKSFFSSTAGKDDNYDTVSRQKVKTYLQKYIDQEDKESPLSDIDLVKMLKRDGLNISRRVVAKYRDEMGLLNSRLRRKQ